MQQQDELAPLSKAQVAARKKWVKALRSGKYKQTREKLGEKRSIGPAHCCLGVACVVVDKKNAKWSGGVLRHFGSMGYPHQNVKDALGIAHMFTKLAELNDVEGFTFEEIADVIDLDTLMRTEA